MKNSPLTEARRMMSIAKVISMAMAKLLVSCWRRQNIQLGELNTKWHFFSGVHVNDGRHVDEVDTRHDEVGVDGLPNQKRRRCYSGLWILFRSWYRYQQWWRSRRRWCRLPERVQKMVIMVKAVVTEWVNGCHVVKGVGGGWVRGDSMKIRILMSSSSY